MRGAAKRANSDVNSELGKVGVEGEGGQVNYDDVDANFRRDENKV